MRLSPAVGTTLIVLRGGIRSNIAVSNRIVDLMTSLILSFGPVSEIPHHNIEQSRRILLDAKNALLEPTGPPRWSKFSDRTMFSESHIRNVIHPGSIPVDKPPGRFLYRDLYRGDDGNIYDCKPLRKANLYGLSGRDVAGRKVVDYRTDRNHLGFDIVLPAAIIEDGPRGEPVVAQLWTPSRVRHRETWKASVQNSEQNSVLAFLLHYFGEEPGWKFDTYYRTEIDPREANLPIRSYEMEQISSHFLPNHLNSSFRTVTDAIQRVDPKDFREDIEELVVHKYILNGADLRLRVMKDYNMIPVETVDGRSIIKLR